MALAGCGQVIGIRDLGVEPLPSSPATPVVDSGPPPTTETQDADSGAIEEKVDAGADANGCSAPAVAGHWTGIFTAADGSMFAGGGKTAGGDLKLEQNCTLVTGSMSVGSCLANMSVLAAIDGSGALDGAAKLSGISLTFTASLSNAKQFQGTFEVTPGGTCGVESGTFMIVRE